MSEKQDPKVFETTDSRSIHYEQIQAAADAFNRVITDAANFGVGTKIDTFDGQRHPDQMRHELVAPLCTNAKPVT